LLKEAKPTWSSVGIYVFATDTVSWATA